MIFRFDVAFISFPAGSGGRGESTRFQLPPKAPVNKQRAGAAGRRGTRVLPIDKRPVDRSGGAGCKTDGVARAALRLNQNYYLLMVSSLMGEMLKGRNHCSCSLVMFAASLSQRRLPQVDENTSQTCGGLIEGDQKVVSIRATLTRRSAGDQKNSPKKHTHTHRRALKLDFM